MFPMRAVKHWNRWCEGAGIGDVARLVEEAGFDAFSMSEHPYPDREWLARGGHHAFDPFVSLSFAAAATTRIRLMTYILVSGYRSPYLTAKAAASFDLLSGGRFTLGTAAGYLKAEFEALGADFDRRGALLDEAIAAWKATWAGV
ncbi:MAG: LLM class flavin-dependent oxidoreductase, partial [Mycobacterium sp.]|uniref:LLM class flavin-dependent oxidoreductase n=1 Tax=Mycobacterium sp. TaxID=1785 RepID=UPI003BB1AE0D